jgi:hypothetical protein
LDKIALVPEISAITSSKTCILVSRAGRASGPRRRLGGRATADVEATIEPRSLRAADEQASGASLIRGGAGGGAQRRSARAAALTIPEAGAST